MTRSTGVPQRGGKPPRLFAGRILANRSRRLRNSPDGFKPPCTSGGYSLCETGPRMRPSAAFSAAIAVSGKVVPCARSASSPINTGSNERARLKTRAAARRTTTVAAVISGPMPSPSMTTIRIGEIEASVIGSLAAHSCSISAFTRTFGGVCGNRGPLTKAIANWISWLRGAGAGAARFQARDTCASNPTAG